MVWGKRAASWIQGGTGEAGELSWGGQWEVDNEKWRVWGWVTATEWARKWLVGSDLVYDWMLWGGRMIFVM